MAVLRNIFYLISFFIVLTSVFHTGELLQCYECSSKENQNCNNLSQMEKYTTLCTVERAIENHKENFLQNLKGDKSAIDSELACGKLAGTNNASETVIIRNCVLQTAFKKFCNELKLEKYVSKWKSCQSDNCNGPNNGDIESNDLQF